MLKMSLKTDAHKVYKPYTDVPQNKEKGRSRSSALSLCQPQLRQRYHLSLRFCRFSTRSSTTLGSASVEVSPSALNSSSAIL